MNQIRTLPKPRTRMTSPWKLMEQLRLNWLLLDAPYQRDIVWDDTKMSELIDSIFHNYYIPPLVFAVRKIRGRQTRMVIDGKQRLTSIKRFMDNELPYIDRSSGEEVKVWYSSETDKGDMGEDAVYLDEEQMNIFNSFEFVCMEYTDITEDDEFDIFSRVQLGVAITSAEKLKAHNTSVAEICRNLTETYIDIQNLQFKKGKPQVFQLIAQIFMTIKNGKDNFRTTPKGLSDFVSDVYYHPPLQLVETLKKTLNVLKALATNEVYTKEAFYMGGSKKYPIKALELILFGVFIASVQISRSNQDFLNDFVELRRYLQNRRDGRLYLGREAFSVGMEFVEEQLSRYDLVSLRPQVVHQVMESDDDDSDELKYSEYEPDYEAAARLPTPSKRSRVENTARHNHPNIAIAKRGRARR